MRSSIVILFFFLFQYLTISAQVLEVKRGDVLVVNGIKGIVFAVDESGCHGTMMSVKAYRGKDNLFCSKPSLLKNLSMISETDGKSNTQELLSYVHGNNLDIQDFPVFAWCESLGEGWYIPAIEQLKTFVNFWLGNDDLEVDWDEDNLYEIDDELVPHTKKINNILLEEGGIPFLNGVFSSSVSKDKKIDVFEYKKEDGSWTFTSKNLNKIDAFSVGRAFYDF